MKKILFLTAALLILFTLHTPSQLISANFVEDTSDKVKVDEFKKQPTNHELDVYFREAGTPEEVIAQFEYEDKLAIYNATSETGLTFDTTNTVNYYRTLDGGLAEVPQVRDGQISTFATIGRDLEVSHSIFGTTYANRKAKFVYANYRWHKTGQTNGDKIAIAIPAGWEIHAQTYVLRQWQSGGNSTWTLKSQTSSTYDLDNYGAVWSLTGKDKVWHKGNASFIMERVSTTAQNKVISKYIEDIGGSTTFGIGWGPASVSITPNKSNNQRAWDTAFTY